MDPGKAFVKPGIQPVMTEAVYYLNHVLDGPAATSRVVELIYPRVVLWNPFSVKMKTSGHIAIFDFRGPQTLDYKSGTTTGQLNIAANNIDADTASSRAFGLGFLTGFLGSG